MLPTDTPGWQALMVSTVMLTGLRLEQAILLPIGALVAFPTVYVLFQSLTGRRYSTLLLSAFVAVELARGPSTYSTFAHSWSYPLLFIFMYAFLRVFRSKNRVPWIIGAAIAFLGLHLVYYSGELLAVIYIIILTSLSFTRAARRRRGPAGERRLPQSGTGKRGLAAVNLSLALVVLFFVFNTVVYDSFLPELSHTSIQDSFYWVFGRFSSLFAGAASQNIPFRVYSPQNTFITWLAVIQFGVILVPVGLFVILSIREFLPRAKKKHGADDFEKLVVWSLIVMTFAFLMIYFQLGQVNISLIPVLLPCASLWSVMRLLQSRPRARSLIPVLICVILLATSGAKFVSSATTAQIGRPSVLSNIQPGADWLLASQTGGGCTVLTDLHTATRIELVAGDEGRQFDFRSYSPTTFGALVGANGPSLSAAGVGCVVIDIKSIRSPTYGESWQVFDPLAAYYDRISRNPAVSAIYDDGSVGVYWVPQGR